MASESIKSRDRFNWQHISTPLANKEIEEYRRKYFWHGFLLFTLACVTPIFHSLYINPSAALAAHDIGLMVGIFLICIGLILTYVQLSKLLAFLTFWFIVISAYVGFGSELLAAIFGLTRSFMYSAKGLPEKAIWLELIVDSANKAISVFILSACVIILFNLRRAKLNSTSSSKLS